MYKIGDLVRLVDDPMSFAVKESDVGQYGVIIEYDENADSYTVLLANGTRKLKLLKFMMEKLYT